MKGVSKFDFDTFYSEDGNLLGVSKQRHSFNEAVEIARHEMGWQDYKLMVADKWACHRTGQTLEGDPTVGWFADDADNGRSCPIWLFWTICGDEIGICDRLEGFMSLDEMKAGEQA